MNYSYDYVAAPPPPPTNYKQVDAMQWHCMDDDFIEQLYDDILAGVVQWPPDNMHWEPMIILHGRLGQVKRRRALQAAAAWLIKSTPFDFYIDLFSFTVFCGNKPVGSSAVRSVYFAALAWWRGQ